MSLIPLTPIILLFPETSVSLRSRSDLAPCGHFVQVKITEMYYPTDAWSRSGGAVLGHFFVRDHCGFQWTKTETGAAHGWRMEGGKEDKNAPLPKMCHTYTTMIKLRVVIPYLKKIQKYITLWFFTSWFLLTSVLYHQKSVTLVISRNPDKNFILIHNFQFF